MVSELADEYRGGVARSEDCRSRPQRAAVGSGLAKPDETGMVDGLRQSSDL